MLQPNHTIHCSISLVTIPEAVYFRAGAKLPESLLRSIALTSAALYNQAMRWQEHDRYGNRIYMTEERWQHALEKRPWLSPYLDEVLETVRRGRRRQDPLNPRKYRYYWPCGTLEPEFNHLVVIVLFGETVDEAGQAIASNYVVNVWAIYIYGRG